jgi:hypothetical protein
MSRRYLIRLAAYSRRYSFGASHIFNHSISVTKHKDIIKSTIKDIPAIKVITDPDDITASNRTLVMILPGLYLVHISPFL